jgi:peptidoglycan L-alanyl-D-glutamate endopeptidase CwlK
MNLEKIICEIQAQLGVHVDGKAGPQTWSAIYNEIFDQSIIEPSHILPTKKLDSRSEKNIATLHLLVQPYALALLEKTAKLGISIKIISGLRTYEEQDELYARGRTTVGDRVTNAKGGESNHNFGIAFDVGVFEGTKYLNESPKYKAVGMIGKDIGLEWGGNWKNIVDQPHYQLRPAWANDLSEKEMLSELRRRNSTGQDYFS